MSFCLEVKNLFVYSKKTAGKALLKNISFSLGVNESLAIIGPSGSGKTTLLKAIFGLLPHTLYAEGELWYQDIALHKISTKAWHNLRKNHWAFIPQGGQSFLNPSVRIYQQMIESDGAASHSLQSIQRRKRICLMLEELGFKHPEQILLAYPHQLSGGEAQRILFCMTLLKEPALICADEPTSALDSKNQLILAEKLKKIGLNTALIMVSHDFSMAPAVCSTALVIEEGSIIEKGKFSTLLNNPQSPVTQGLVDSFNQRCSALKHKGST